jgi:hypothetical protein
MLRVLLSSTRGVNDKDMLEDVLPRLLDSIPELESLSLRTDNEEFRKKLVSLKIYNAITCVYCIIIFGSNTRILTRITLTSTKTSRSGQWLLKLHTHGKMKSLFCLALHHVYMLHWLLSASGPIGDLWLSFRYEYTNYCLPFCPGTVFSCTLWPHMCTECKTDNGQTWVK